MISDLDKPFLEDISSIRSNIFLGTLTFNCCITDVIQLEIFKYCHYYFNFGEKIMEGTISYRFKCDNKGAGLTHFVIQSEDSPF